MSARIIFNASTNPVTLEVLRDRLGLLLPYKCELDSLDYFGHTIPQLVIHTRVPIALQLEEDPEIVLEEISEMVTDAEDEGFFDEKTREQMRQCTAAIDLHTTTPPKVSHFEEGGMLISTPNDVDPRDHEIERILLSVASFVKGWVYDNLNGGWIVG